MKNQIKLLGATLSIALLTIFSSCNQDSINPALVLDEVFLPTGYVQIDNPSMDALTRLDEFRLENKNDHYYYLKLKNANMANTSKWIFPQKELKIEYVDYDESAKAVVNQRVQGVIVKRIRGDWNEEVFIIVEGRPKPQGGLQHFYEYISNNIKYPVEAKNAGIEGRVFVEFVVDQKGKLTELKAVKGIGAGCDEEAIRVLSEAPKWIPGMVGEKAGKVRMILPISYKLG